MKNFQTLIKIEHNFCNHAFGRYTFTYCREVSLLIFNVHVRFASLFSRVKVGGQLVLIKKITSFCDNLFIFLCGPFVFIINFFGKGCPGSTLITQHYFPR